MRKIQIVSNLFWDFPTNFDWYAKIPILGNFSLAIILLVGTRNLFYIPSAFYPGAEIPLRTPCPDEAEEQRNGNLIPRIIPLVDGDACRSRKHPGCHRRDLHGRSGALFWMWISAFFGMSTAFVEATLSQIFKERKDDEYVGGPAILTEEDF